MYRKTRAMRRHERARVIRRKLKLLQFVWGEEYSSLVVKGKLSKGKIHCSCKYCRYNRYFRVRSRQDARSLFQYVNDRNTYLK